MKKSLVWLLFGCILLSSCSLFPGAQQAVVVPQTTATPDGSAMAALDFPADAMLATATLVPTCPVCPTCPAPASPTVTPNVTLTPTKTTAPTNTTTPMPYALQSGSPVYVQNFARVDKGCNWMGVAGQVFSNTNQAQTGLVVAVRGTYGATKINSVMLTGYSVAQPYGPGAYEIVLGNSIVATSNTLTIQLFDLSGKALSNPIPFSTQADCSKNLIIINFVQR